jgi:hypothetical protein
MITFIVPTIGRESLIKTLNSIECREGDEILIVSDGFRVNAQELDLLTASRERIGGIRSGTLRHLSLRADTLLILMMTMCMLLEPDL